MEINETVIQQAIGELRKTYLISTGDWGTVIRRRDLPAFKEKAFQLKEMLRFYWNEVRKSVGAAIFQACKTLVEERMEFLCKSPPGALLPLLMNCKSNEEAADLIAGKLAARVESELFAGEGPRMRITEKDVCHATFSNPKFIACLERSGALGDGWLKKYFEEHNALREKETGGGGA